MQFQRDSVANLVATKTFEFFPVLRSLQGGDAYYHLRTILLPLVMYAAETPQGLQDDWKDTKDLFAEAITNCRTILESHASEISWPLGKLYNGFFDSLDAVVYYCMIRV